MTEYDDLHCEDMEHDGQELEDELWRKEREGWGSDEDEQGVRY